MKKSLLIISMMTLFACNRENENLGIADNLSESSKTVSHRSGDIGGLSVQFTPSNENCGYGDIIGPITTLPYGVPSSDLNITTFYNPFTFSIDEISLPQLIIGYLYDQGITVEETLYDNGTPPPGSYFENNFYKEYTFTDGKNQLDDDGNPNSFDFNSFTSTGYMDHDYASIAIQNAYQKITSLKITKNNIKAIRIFYEDDSCSDSLEDRRSLKIQVIYSVNYAVAEPGLEP